MNRIREIRENKKLSLKKTTELLKGIDDKTVIKKFSSEDLLQELLDRKVLEPVKDKPINLDDVFLLHK